MQFLGVSFLTYVLIFPFSSVDEPDSKMRKDNEPIDISSIRSKLQKKETRLEPRDTNLAKEYDHNSGESDEELDAKKRKREEIKREIIELQREMKGIKNKKAKENQNEDNALDDKQTDIDDKNDMLVSFHQEQRKYASKKLPHKGKSREDQTMALLAKFKAKLGNYAFKSSDYFGAYAVFIHAIQAMTSLCKF